MFQYGNSVLFTNHQSLQVYCVSWYKILLSIRSVHKKKLSDVESIWGEQCVLITASLSNTSVWKCCNEKITGGDLYYSK